MPSTPTARKKTPSSREYKAIAAQFAAAQRAQTPDDAASNDRPRPAAARAGQTHSTTSALERRRAVREAARKSAYERRWLWTVAFWLWLLAVHAAGVYFFTSGFLLTRLVLDEQSSCDASPLQQTTGSTGAATAVDGCWHPKTFERAVVVVIDALRYDFTVPEIVSHEENDDSSSRNINATTAEIYHNAFPFLYETAVAHPTHAFLRPFIADPPTTTLQRLKGLTTGTLPTFMDMGSNFAGTAIEEDNLLAQLRTAGKKLVHLGDDTWTALFPGYFEANSSHAYDSFNVWDLHTVDNGVLEHIFPLVERDPEQPHQNDDDHHHDWDVLIAHCLGVDHAGHRYGPNHPAMRAKLAQMDAFVRRLVAALDDDTLLVVMGDHGMDSKGDHGGESDDEVEAALWMYARRPLFGRTAPDRVAPPPTAKERPVNQIDLVPTLALLLGIPIPYNNLGWPIEEAFVGPAGDDWAKLAAAAAITAAGIHRYQTSYYAARGGGGADPALSSGGPIRPPAAELGGASAAALADAFAALSAYQAKTLRMCKDLWARFDVPSMVLGIAIVASSVVTLLLYISSGAPDEADDDDVVVLDDAALNQAELLLELQGELVDGEGAGGGGGSSSSGSAQPQNADDNDDDDGLRQLQQLHRSLATTGFLTALPILAVGVVLSFLRGGAASVPWYVGAGYAALASTVTVTTRLLLGGHSRQKNSQGGGGLGIAGRRLRRLLPSSVWGWLAVVVTLAPSAGFASNSYTIWEDRILLFFLATFGFVAALASLRLARPADRALGVYHAVVFVLVGRVAALSTLCREEQMPYCTSTYYASATSSTSAPWQLVIPFAVALVLPSLVRAFYEPTRSYAGLAPVWIGGVLRGGLLLAALYWTLDAADNGGWWTTTEAVGGNQPPVVVADGGADATATATPTTTLVKMASVYVAQITLGLALVAGTVAFVWAGPCVAVSARAVPAQDGTSRAQRAQVAVLGYANAHGARYLLLPANLLVAGVLLSKPMGGGALALMLWQVLSLVELLDLLGSAPESDASGVAGLSDGDVWPSTTTTTASSSSSSEVAVAAPVVLAMLGAFHYFTTGHQATLSSIQWDSAFIPLVTLRYPWSPLVVLANTFPGHLLAAAAVPLLVLWKTGPRQRGVGLLSATSRALARFAAYFAVEALATMVWAAHLRRHLMLYRVFNPRFMLAAAVLLVVDAAGLLLALPGLRANTLAVREVFGWVEDY
ncbi:phosphoethanolamine n-phosphodiesterase [Niveomyces insectorum RCEF 264]|uniref:Phosphoethanolamine n-phosphodiesterase n=1 Tax=Niveomyces insectorum RCEF 264 TaxID=1081102 RepID=A0A167Y995_9HYPO|nr:phosphoethanolamine n-phosphodiesterase [Niveomyces insectorum RCEF 264]